MSASAPLPVPALRQVVPLADALEDFPMPSDEPAAHPAAPVAPADALEPAEAAWANEPHALLDASRARQHAALASFVAMLAELARLRHAVRDRCEGEAAAAPADAAAPPRYAVARLPSARGFRAAAPAATSDAPRVARRGGRRTRFGVGR
jgi:hypothetical protein